MKCFIAVLLSCSVFYFINIPKAQALKNPVLLIHGATMGGAVLRVGPLFFGKYFQRIPEHLESIGAKTEVVALSTDSSIGERAFVIKNFLETKLKNQKVNIIAHSLGGLDARYLVSILKSTQVASITTIGTPHQGTPLADWAVRQMREGGFWYHFFRFLGYDFKGRRFLPELTTHSMGTIFNPRVKNMPGIRYFSAVATGDPWKGTMSALLLFPYFILQNEANGRALEANDGLVTASSQTWGEVLARVTLDHLAQMNHYTFRWSREAESFALYTQIVKHLEKEGL